MMRVLVTGASGFLGGALTRDLRQNNFEVISASRSAQGSGFSHIQFDLANEHGWHNLPNEIDAVVHCAAYIPSDFSSIEESEHLWRVNVLGTLRLLKWARTNGARKFIYCSSHSVYRRPLPYPINEDHPAYPSYAVPYAVSKLAAEIFTTSLRNDVLSACSMRLSSLYGLGMRSSNVVTHFVALAQAGETIEIKPHPKSQLDLLYIEDACQALRLSLSHVLLNSVYNVGAGKGTTLEGLAQACWQIFGTGDQPKIVCSEAIPQSHSVLDITRARRDLGYQPVVDIRSGLRKMQNPFGEYRV